MSGSEDNAAQGATYWYVPVLRAIPAVIIAAIITFSADHSSQLGLLAFGAFAAATGAVLVATSPPALRGDRARWFFVSQGLVSLVLGVIALAFSGGGLPFLLFIMSGWAALTGFLELYCGIRSRGRSALSRDWVFVGALTAVFAIIVLLVPPEFTQVTEGPGGVAVQLTASIITVGALGAYAAVIAVYLIIGGLSLKWGTQKISQPAAVAEQGQAS